MCSTAISPGSKQRDKVHFAGEVPHRQDSLTGSEIGAWGISGRTWEETSETSGGQHVLDVETGRGFHSSSDEEFASTPGPDYRRRGPFIDMSSVFREASGRSLPYHEDLADPEYCSDEDSDPDDRNEKKRRKRKSREDAPEQRITIFALRLALIEKGASGLGTLSFLWATVVILGGFATTVNETDFWVVTLIILAESSRIFSRSHELEWQQLSVRSHESLGQRFLRAASNSYMHNVTFARQVKSKIKRLIHSKVEEGSQGAAGARGEAASPAKVPVSTRRRTSRKSSRQKAPQAATVNCKDTTRTWNAPSLRLLPYTHHLVTTKLISRLLYAVQLLSAIMSIGLAIWRLLNQEFSYNPGNTQPTLPNIKVSMNVFYILSVVEAGMFLIERFYWEYKIRVSELLQRVNTDADLGPENLLTVTQFFYDVYSQCLKGSVFDGLDMDLVSYSITWLQAEYFKQQLGGARLLNRLVSRQDGKPRRDHFAADCLRRLGTTPGIIERLVEMLSWNSKHEEPLLSEVAVIICRLVVYNRNCSRIVAIPGSIEGIMGLLVPHEWPNEEPSEDKNHIKATKAYLDLRLNGLRILKHLCKDHKNSLKIGEARGLLSILILFIEIRGEKSFSDCSEKNFFPQQLKTYKKSLQVLGLLAAATNTSGWVLRRRIVDVVSGLKNLRDVIEFGKSLPELQRSSVDILFHLAMDVDVRKTIGATGGVIRNLYNLFASYDDIPRLSNPSASLSGDRKSSQERQLASEMAGKTISRIVLQNEKNCLKVMNLVSDQGEEFLNCMVRFLGKPLETNNAAPREIASCSAQILRSVLQYAHDSVKQQVARESAQVVWQLIQRRLQEGRSSLYESYLGLASRLLDPLDQESYSQLVGYINKSELAQQLLKNLKHTPNTNKYPRIRRYSVELLITLSDKDDSFLNVFRSININLTDVLSSTMDSISEVENFCLFSGLVGYTRHQEEMEELVARAIHHIETLDKSRSEKHDQ